MPSSSNHHHGPSHTGATGPNSTPAHRSTGSGDGSVGGSGGGGGGGGSTAASKRREANRLAAARFRTRKKDQVVDLEGRVAVLEQESSVLKGEVRILRGKLGIETEAPVVGPIGGPGGGGAVISVSMQERVGTPMLGGPGGSGHGESPGMSHRSLNSMGPGDEDEDDEMDMSASSSKKRRKVGGRAGDGGASEEEVLQLKEQVRGYQATMRAMQEEIAMLKGKKPSVGRTPSFTLDPSLADVKTGYSRSSARSASGGSSRQYHQHSDSATSNDLADDAMAAQGLASLHLPLPRPGYERGDTGTSSHLSLPPLSPVLRIDSASPNREYEGESARGGGGYTSGSHGGGTSVMMGRSIHGLPTSRPHSPLSLSPALPQPGRATSPMSIERLSSPSPLGAGYKDSSSAARTLNALQNAAFAVGMQLGGSGPSSPLGAASGRESPLARNRSWGLGGATPSGLGLASLPHSRAGSRGLDSPISAERSGANDDDDSPDSGGYQDYFGRYAASANANAAAGGGATTGGPQQAGSRLREERDFDKTEDGEDDVTPPAKPSSRKVVDVDPSLLESEAPDKEAEKEIKQEGMEVDDR